MSAAEADAPTPAEEAWECGARFRSDGSGFFQVE
jgi:hypothetical protein